MHHELKTLPCFFEAVLDGRKKFEVRYNGDRSFQAADTATLHEYDKAEGYTGRQAHVLITYVTAFQQKEDYVVFGFRQISSATDNQNRNY